MEGTPVIFQVTAPFSTCLYSFAIFLLFLHPLKYLSSSRTSSERSHYVFDAVTLKHLVAHYFNDNVICKARFT